MTSISKLVIFELSGKRFALDIDKIEQIIQMVEISSLPKMPNYIPGVISFYGEIIPVIDMNFFFNRQKKEITLSDQLMIIKTSFLRCALWVNNTLGIIDAISCNIKDSEDVYDAIPYIQGIFKDDEGIVLISEPDKFFDAKELEKINELIEDNVKNKV